MTAPVIVIQFRGPMTAANGARFLRLWNLAVYGPPPHQGDQALAKWAAAWSAAISIAIAAMFVTASVCPPL